MMSPGFRKLVLTAHVTTSLGWMGAVLAYVAMSFAAMSAGDAPLVRAAWLMMDFTGWFAIVPLALAAFATGLVNALGTPWGLFRHYWVLAKLILTLFATAILLGHMPDVSAIAAVARAADEARLLGLGGDMVHAVGGLVVLLLIAVLAIYKPKGMTRYGWRKQHG